MTQQIQVLERELGAKLFQRTKRSVHLTVAGRLTLEQALRTLQQAERTAVVARQAGRGEKGYVEIGYVGSAAFSGILSKTIFAYRKTNPNVELRPRSQWPKPIQSRLPKSHNLCAEVLAPQYDARQFRWIFNR